MGSMPTDGLWKKIFRPVVSPFLSEGESWEDELRKYVVIPIDIFALIVLPWYTLWLFIQADYHRVPAPIISVAVSLWTLIRIYIDRVLTAKQCYVYFTVVFSVSFIVADVQSYSRYDQWSLIVVYMDILLLTRCHSSWVVASFAVSTLYIVVVTLDDGFGLGMRNLVVTEEECTCSYSTLGAVMLLSTRLTVCLFDFALTRGFAASMVSEHHRAQQGVAVAHSVTKALERFDLDEAEEVLGALTDAELKEAFEGLTQNLRLYRPYLPDSLFTFVVTRASTARNILQLPPGRDGREVAMVFTDIQSSTALWEFSTYAMGRALVVHNKAVRECIAEFGGYEVKTVGDSFMVAFETSHEAACFALSVQCRLYDSTWPADLLRHPLCHPVEGQWNGLRVRMGLNVGMMELHMNHLTGRADYFGIEVNKAARLEGMAAAGTVALPHDVYSTVGWEGEETPPAVKHVGCKVLKGMDHPISIVLMCPARLRERLSYAEGKDTVLPRGTSPGAMPLTLSYDPVFLRSRMSTSQASIGCVSVDYGDIGGYDDHLFMVNDMVSAVVDAAKMNEGSVVSVFSHTLVASWNVAKSCQQHITRSARFAFCLKSSFSNEVRAGVALCSGTVFHGNVGTDSHRYATVIGASVEVAVLLSAAGLGTSFALVGALRGEPSLKQDPQGQHHIRLIDEVEIRGGGKVDVYELRVEAFSDKWGFASCEALPGWSAECRSALAERDVDYFARTPALLLDDPVLSLAVRLMKDGTHLVSSPLVLHTSPKGCDEDTTLATTLCPPSLDGRSPGAPPLGLTE